ncbi:hypothetical protein PVAND_009171 [Polypedilum vanderplanki]|uniref:Uncharacterized protein n=1 Tax=Polypedilum vanderplanki TaxID=319348 RepID=A0A9J6CCY5_POLVA|nr:hypothetical protein PVAND_009171 [Polypedilum vanderplanki]
MAQKKILKILQNYCQNTNLHGFIYIVQPSRHKIERFFWSILIFTSFILTLISIYKLYIASQKNPIIFYTDQNVVHVQDLNFPSVSICPGIIYRTSIRIVLDYDLIALHISEKTFNIDNLPDEILKMFHVTSLINRDVLFQSQYKKFAFSTTDFMDILHSFELPWFSSFSRIKNTTVNFFDAIWLKNYYAVLTQTLWKGGFCYTFNFPKLEDFFYVDKIVKDFYFQEFAPSEDFGKFSKMNLPLPLKSPLPGNGYEIRYNEIVFAPTDQIFISQINNLTLSNRHIYFNLFNFSIPKTSFGGFNLIFHDSYEIIPWNDKIFHSNPDTTIKLLVTPSIKRIDESLKIRNVDERRCYLPNERKLNFLKVYNKVNCEHECLTSMTLNLCRCVQFFMVRGKSTRICGFKDEKCYLEIESKFLTNKHICKCYENCEVVKYDVKVTFTQKNKHKQFDIHRQIDSKIIIEMSTQVAVVVSERQSTTIIDFLSLSGGVFGLFAGFSVLSAAEIVYYFLISPISEYRTENSTKVHALQEEIKIENKIVKYFSQILQYSSIHSFNHIANEQKGFIERLIWLILFVGSMICTYFMVIQVFGMIDTNIVAISMEGRATNFEEIPFPAITVQGSLNNALQYITLDLDKLYKYINITNKLQSDYLKEFDLGGATHVDDLQNENYKFKLFSEGYKI